MKRLFFLLLMFTLQSYAQKGCIRGIVENTQGEKIPFAAVSLKGSSGTTANAEGRFLICDLPAGEHKLQAFITGYAERSMTVRLTGNDTVNVLFKLEKKSVALQQVEVESERDEMIVRDSVVRMEIYSAAFIKKNVPENLMQIVNSINGVQEQLNCGVCNTADIHINGLEGPYTLVMIDGMPVVSALSTVYGLNGIPASIIDRIEVAKGPSSAFYGSEAIAGTINVITKNPLHAPWLEVGSFVSSQYEKNTDLTVSMKGSKFSVMASGSWFSFNELLDRNLDGFTDIALAQRGTAFLKTRYAPTEKFTLSSGFRFYGEERFGGQLAWQREHKGSESVYGEWVRTRRAELMSSMINRGAKSKTQTDLSLVSHFQDSYYGVTSFDADQTTIYTSIRNERTINKRHTLITGLSQKTNLYKDNTPVSGGASGFQPGLFVEDELRFNNGAYRFMPGSRLDYYKDHGFILSPRLNLQVKTGQFSRIQASAGRGFRVVSLFTEDHAALTGSRQVIISEKLLPESSWSSSATFTRALSFPGIGSIDFSGFYTRFSNQIIPDYSLENFIVYSNLSGYSLSRGLSVNLSQSFKFPFKISGGVSLIDAFEIETVSGENVKKDILFAPDYSAVWQAAYTFKKAGVSLSWSGKLYGPMELPEYPAPFERAVRSPVFAIQNLQLTKPFKGFEFSLAIKNLLDYVQPTPLIDPANPFSDSFDTSYIYGPMQGRRAVLAVRYTRF